MSVESPPLFRDPIHDGAADPVVIFNREEGAWWMIYTARRADGPPSPDVGWVHGTDLGVASSRDAGSSWTYRGTVRGLDLGWGRQTYWAPEIVDDGRTYHMYVSVINGTPSRWEGHERRIRHYVSSNLIDWSYESTLNLSSRYVIDPCVIRRPDGTYRMWYKDEADGSTTWCADSPDLYAWSTGARVLSHQPHEGPNVFRLGGFWWMLVDEWSGQRVLRSVDLENWTMQGHVLDKPGRRADDAAPGLHADVVPVSDEEAIIFYFTHPGRNGRSEWNDYETRRSSIQAARLRVAHGTLACDRDESLPTPLLTERT